MSHTSLAKFSVPIQEAAGVSNNTFLMPKLKYRFRISFYGFGADTTDEGNVLELTRQVKSCGRPKPEFETIVVDTYNSKINLIGKPKWGQLSVVLRDDSQSRVTKVVGEQMQKQFNFMEQSSAASGYDYKFDMLIEMLDGGNGVNTPTVLEYWNVYGCYIGSVEYGDLDYGSNDPVEMTLSITFDNAMQVDDGDYETMGGIGASVERTTGSWTEN